MNSIEVKNFTKKFGDFIAVDNISFEVEEGSIFGFLGPNGAGKSTTINTLCTIQEKTSGDMKINGFDVSTQMAQVRFLTGEWRLCSRSIRSSTKSIRDFTSFFGTL